MKNWRIFLQFVPWCNLFGTLSQKIVVEYASSDIGYSLMTPNLWSEYIQISFTNQVALTFYFLFYKLLQLKQWFGPKLLAVSA